MYADLDLHTQTTISAGRHELYKKFAPIMKVCRVICSVLSTNDSHGFLMQDYITHTNLADDNLNFLTDDGEPGNDDITPKGKSWEFIKLHLRTHIFDDIENKGVQRNYSTKPNEKMHGPIKVSYLRRTNFKDFGDQVCIPMQM